MKIIGQPKGPTDVKRLYLEGVKIVGKCPHCDSDVSADLNKEYTNYRQNESVGFYGMCHECDEGWELELILKASLEVGEYQHENSHCSENI